MIQIPSQEQAGSWLALTSAMASSQAPTNTSECGPQAHGSSSTSLSSVAHRPIAFNIISIPTTNLFSYLYLSSELRHATSPATQTGNIGIVSSCVSAYSSPHPTKSLWLLAPPYAHCQCPSLNLNSFTWITYRPRQMSFSNQCLHRPPCLPGSFPTESNTHCVFRAIQVCSNLAASLVPTILLQNPLHPPSTSRHAITVFAFGLPKSSENSHPHPHTSFTSLILGPS